MPAERKRSFLAFWSTLTVALVLLYVLSFGPACWITSRVAWHAPFVNFTYQPLMRLWWRGGAPDSADMLSRYGCLFAEPTDWRFSLIVEGPELHTRYVFWQHVPGP